MEARAWYLRGRVAELEGDPVEADRAMAWVTRLDRPNVAAWLEVGDYHLRGGRAREALAAYSRASDLDPSHAAAWEGQARAWWSLGDGIEARRALARARSVGGVPSEIDVALGVDAGDEVAAAATLRAWAATDPRARLEQGLWAVRLGLPEAALWLCPLVRDPERAPLVPEGLGCAAF